MAEEDRWKMALRERAKLVQHVFGSPEGKILLKRMTKLHTTGEMRGSDPYQTYYNLGARDLIAELCSLCDLSEEDLESIEVITR